MESEIEAKVRVTTLNSTYEYDGVNRVRGGVLGPDWRPGKFLAIDMYRLFFQTSDDEGDTQMLSSRVLSVEFCPC